VGVCAAHGLPVLAHTGEKEITEIEPCFNRYPGVNWIMAHAGMGDPEEYVQVGTRYPNVYADTTFSRCPRGLVEWFVARGLEDKLLWGTDAAFLNAPGQLGKILFAKLSPAQKEKILGLNARKAFRL
jgi:predicted TIM-barrel fold metal-dependent hydrolase